MMIVEGWRAMIRAVQLSGIASHLEPTPVKARWEATPRRLALAPGSVVVRFSVVTPQQAAIAVELAQTLAVARWARLPADLAAEDLGAASQ
jgi:hypothetical protein